ncbi:MAG: hypothetical protein ABI220_01525 [Candidatus Saccharimonadales bacterium]
MNSVEAKNILDKVVGQIFGYQNPLSLEQAMQKFAFDVRLPQQVLDSTDGTASWAQSVNATRYMKMANARAMEQSQTGLRPPKQLTGLQDVIAAWNEINYTTTERLLESDNIAESDNINNSQSVFRSQDIRRSKNVVFSDNLSNCEFLVACQGSVNSAFCIRISDCSEVSNSFEISWCAKLNNCLFMHDCGDMQDSMFCTNMKGGRFCIANMQFDEAEYRRLRNETVRWVLTS